MPTVATTTLDTVELASRLRLGVTRLARKLRQESDPGLTPSLLSALAAVERGGRLSVGELSAAEQVQPPTMTRFVASLVEAGLVKRESDPADRRVAWLSVTPEGAKLLGRARRRKEAFLVRRLRHLDPEELAVLERAAPILERLVGGGS
ncbi:MAG: MarR family winged helix-turn-helix transcriptional regulator [Actinomycetota bacterium]